MDIKAIVYESNTGSTKKYAETLSEETGIEAWNVRDAAEKLAKGSAVIFFGWLSAGRIVGYKKASKLFDIKAVCATGLAGYSQHQIDRTAKGNNVSVPLFYLRGGYYKKSLRGMNRFLMGIAARAMLSSLKKIENKDEEILKNIDVLKNGGDLSDDKYLAPVREFLKG